ncbi:MAG: serine/threonine-protein kinase, partial [Pseudomonadota bacterium]
MSEIPVVDLGPYRLTEPLGSGGMGSVFLAEDTRLGRYVAVKRVASSRSEVEYQRRFRREAATLARFSHPAIVQIYDVVERDGETWIVMEWIQGRTLARQLEEGPLPIGEVLEIGRQVAEGLAEAHGQGILHRDLKTENVMQQRSGHAKILDFGLAKPEQPEDEDSGLTGSGRVLGTSRAMSPEQARGLPLDVRSDLFSLGVLLYELAVGEAPFRGRSKAEVLVG